MKTADYRLQEIRELKAELARVKAENEELKKMKTVTVDEARIRAENKRLKEQFESHKDLWERGQNAVADLCDDRDRLAEALRYYANQDNWIACTSVLCDGWHIAAAKRGECMNLARSTLAACVTLEGEKDEKETI